MSETNFNEAKSALSFSQSLIDRMRQENMEEEMPLDGSIQDVPEEPQEVKEVVEEKPEEIDVEKMINEKVSGMEEKITAKIEKKLTDALDES